MLLLERVVAKNMSLVILLRQVGDDRPRLPEDDPGVRILNCFMQSDTHFMHVFKDQSPTGNTTVWIKVDERRLLDILELDRLDFVWHLQLFQDKDNLVSRFISLTY